MAESYECGLFTMDWKYLMHWCKWQIDNGVKDKLIAFLGIEYLHYYQIKGN